MQKVLDAINALQAVPFTINRPILDFLRRAGPERGVFDIDIVTAEAMACVDRFYVPLNMDFRGRIYPIPHFNFTRADPVRALFLFADGKPIGDAGLRYLKAHVAARADGNKWSPVEKPSALNLVSRVAWTNDNLETLHNIGEAVLRRDDPASLAWAFPKEPYQFLAACVELVQAREVGPNFNTRLPLTFDASCSGLQHLCAMTRADEGRYVNLIAGDEPDDFYSHVAFKTYLENPEIRELMKDNPFNRAIVKQPTMSYFYGSRPGGFAKTPRQFRKRGNQVICLGGDWKPYGMTKQIVDFLKKKKKDTRRAKELACAIYRAIEGKVPKAAAVLHYLRQLAGICAEHELPLRWETPLGLPVINRYHDPETERIAVVVKGRRRDVKLTVGDKESIAKDRAEDAVTANFIHSADAAHLQLIALAAADEKIPLASVHDCFGCLAPDAERLNQIIREQFVLLHKRHNWLTGVLVSAKRDLPKNTELPTSPPLGDLDIDRVVKSFHAFS
jgi:DNA-directed RNA polymerase